MVILLVLLLNQTLFCNEFYILVNKDNLINEINKAEVKSLFLKKRNSFQGQKLKLIEYPLDSHIRKQFSKKYLGLSPLKVEIYWMQQMLNDGVQAPKIKNNIRSIYRYLQKYNQAISYCDHAFKVPDNLRKIKIQ